MEFLPDIFIKSSLTGPAGHASSFVVATVERRGISAEFDRSIQSLPASMAKPVRVPADTKGRVDFLKNLAAKSAARLSAGGTALLLVLLSTETAQAQSSEVSLNALDGVKSVEMLEDGSASVTLENGSVLRLPAGSFTVSGGDVLVPQDVALQLTEAAAVGGGVVYQAVLSPQWVAVLHWPGLPLVAVEAAVAATVMAAVQVRQRQPSAAQSSMAISSTRRCFRT